MMKRDHPSDARSAAGRFWLSRIGVALVVLLGIAGFLLAYEHRAHIPGTHWFLGALFVLAVLMHGIVHWVDGRDRHDDEPRNGERD